MSPRRIALGAGLAAACLAATLAMPVQVWRTGRMTVPPLDVAVADGGLEPARLWIDADAACGHSARTDVDDCLALWLLAGRSRAEIAGVSTVFGNAPLEATHRTARQLLGLLWPAPPEGPAVYRGAADALREAGGGTTKAHAALARALERGPLTILALGPLTNIAEVVTARPELAPNVEELVAVMGRRIGHLFHPSEGSGRGAFLGHGPVFRDFNFSADPDAVRRVVDSRVPLTLIPYDAATSVEITREDLARVAARGAAGRWIASRSEAWLEYWRTDVGRAGFYPFDLMAAAYVLEPALFRCARVHAWVGRDPALFLPLFRPVALLVEPSNGRDRSARYCPAVSPAFDDALRGWIEVAGRPSESAGR